MCATPFLIATPTPPATPPPTPPLCAYSERCCVKTSCAWVKEGMCERATWRPCGATCFAASIAVLASPFATAVAPIPETAHSTASTAIDTIFSVHPLLSLACELYCVVTSWDSPWPAVLITLGYCTHCTTIFERADEGNHISDNDTPHIHKNSCTEHQKMSH